MASSSHALSDQSNLEIHQKFALSHVHEEPIREETRDIEMNRPV